MKQREREQKAKASMKKEYVEAGGKNRRVAEGDKRLKANQKEESVADIIQNKNYSMREALAKVWETSANNNPFEMFGANTPTSNQGVKTVKRDQSRKPMGPVDTAKRQIKRPISSSKTETGKPVTKVEINNKFFKAESYHVEYFNRNSNAPYCQIVIKPKLLNFKKKHKNKLIKS